MDKVSVELHFKTKEEILKGLDECEAICEMSFNSLEDAGLFLGSAKLSPDLIYARVTKGGTQISCWEKT